MTRKHPVDDAVQRPPDLGARGLRVGGVGDDAFFPQEDGRRLAEALPNARLEVSEGARTFSMRDQPDVLASLIAEFATQTRPIARGAERDRC